MVIIFLLISQWFEDKSKRLYLYLWFFLHSTCFFLKLPFQCLAGNWTSQKREAHVGASPEVGRHEVCVWRFALPALVQSIHGPASEAPAAADLRPPRRIRVLSVSESESPGGCSLPTLGCVSVGISFDCPRVAGAVMDLSSCEVVPATWIVTGDPGASQTSGMDGVKTLRCWRRSRTFNQWSMLKKNNNNKKWCTVS